MNIVLITVGQPSTNPRIVKEADSLHEAGHVVTVLYAHVIHWADGKDITLLEKVNWKYKLIGGAINQERPLFYFTRLRFKLARLFNKYFGNKFMIAERAQARNYDELLSAAKKIKADWYIGHNLGALAVAVKAARFNRAKSGFDFEDYHRGEMNQPDVSGLNRVIYLENKYVPQLDYISASSPLITKKIEYHFPQFKHKVITLLNAFPLTQQPTFREKSLEDKTLQLFWFSQTIGFERGLENVIEALESMQDPNIHLTLAGNCNQEFKTYLLHHAPFMFPQIHFAGIVSPDDLPAFSSKFDIGLAVELSYPVNKNICLANKIFTYLLAGNAILISETAMQTAFNEEHKIGKLFNLSNVDGFKHALLEFKVQTILNKQRIHNYNLANSKLNWEMESKNLIGYLNKT